MEREFYANIIKQNKKKRVLLASVVKHQIFNLKKNTCESNPQWHNLYKNTYDTSTTLSFNAL